MYWSVPHGKIEEPITLLELLFKGQGQLLVQDILTRMAWSMHRKEHVELKKSLRRRCLGNFLYGFKASSFHGYS